MTRPTTLATVATAALLSLAATVGSGLDPARQDPQDPQPAVAERPEPAAADVASIDALVTALYDTVSGGVGEVRDWDRLRSLFDAGARMQILAPDRDGGSRLRTLTVEDYIEGAGDTLAAIGFREVEIHRETHHWGDLAQVFTTYEGHRADQDEPFLRGINSLQLARIAGRWRILSIVWQQESEARPLPARYLPAKKDR